MVNNLIGVKDILRILYFVVGIWIIYDIKNCKNYFKHSCGMTSMYRLPQFQTLHNDDKNNYRMYIYGEGNYFRKIINTNIFEGIPIIYIPGNRAPADMARSIGSILQNKTEMRNVPYHFNVFAAHLNEEPSTFDVKTLKRHAKYLEDSIKYVDSLYKKRNHKFVVIGHSISGIAFKIALSQSKWLRDNVKFVISLGTAYKEHQFKITGDFINLWREMNTMVEVPIISFHGGLMDENAEESLTGNDDGFSYNTQSMDRVWTMADHNCLVWCNQLQRSISRLLFEYAEDKGDKFSRQNIDKVLDKIFNSTTIEYPVFSSNDKRFKLLNIEETSKNDYIFVIRKTNKNIGPLYQYYTTLKATKDYFYDHKMTYTYSLDPLANKISYYYDTTSEYKLIKEDEIVALSPSIASTKKNYRNSDKIRIFSIPFLSPNIVYRVTTTDYSKIIFKSKLNQAISQDNILIFNFFDQDDNENGKLFIIPHPEKYNDIKENRMEINIELGLTVIRVIKLNITSIPFMLSFIAMLFSFNSNILTKFFIFNFIIFCLSGSIITTFIMVFLSFIIIYFIELILFIIIQASKMIKIRNLTTNIYKWFIENVIKSSFTTMISLSLLFYQPSFILFSFISFLTLPSLLLFITSLLLHIPAYFIFYELPHMNFGFYGFRFFELSALLLFLFNYKFKNGYRLTISRNPYITLLPYIILMILGPNYFSVWEYVVLTQTISTILLLHIDNRYC